MSANTENQETERVVLVSEPASGSVITHVEHFVGKKCVRGVAAISVRTSFEALHFWAEAPEQVAFLRNPHRHVFHVKVEAVVDHDNRDVEFFILKSLVDTIIRVALLAPNGRYVTRPGVGGVNLGLPTLSASCEQMAAEIALQLELAGHTVGGVFVSEDGENGGWFRPLSTVVDVVPTV